MSNISSEIRYPIIVDCINNPLPPSRADIRTLALRIYTEIRAESASRFRLLRRAMLISRAALGLRVR